MEGGDFKVVVLGSGAAVPTLDRGTTSLCVVYRQYSFLLDAGEGVQIALRKAKIRFHGLTGVCISHMHGDHVLGLPGLLSSLSMLGRTRALDVWGPPGLEAWLQATLAATRTHLGYPLLVHVWTEGAAACWSSANLTFSSFPVRHRVPCWGVRFDEVPRQRKLNKAVLSQLTLDIEALRDLKAGRTVTAADGTPVDPEAVLLPAVATRSFVYTADTLPCDAVVQAARGADLLFHDATFAEGMRKRAKETGHSTGVQAAEVAREAGVGRLVLGHISARYAGRASELIAEASAVFPATEVAVDGGILELPPRGYEVDKFST